MKGAHSSVLLCVIFLEIKILLLEKIQYTVTGQHSCILVFPPLPSAFVLTQLHRKNLVYKQAELGSLVAQQMKSEEIKEVKPLDTFPVSFDELS